MRALRADPLLATIALFRYKRRVSEEPHKVATYNMSISDEGHTAPFQCLVEDHQPPDLLRTRELTKIVVEQYANTEQGLKKWRQMKPFVINWTEKDTARSSVALRFDVLVEHLRTHRARL